MTNQASIERSSQDLTLAKSLLSLHEERIDGKNEDEGTANSNSLSEELNIDDFVKSFSVKCSSLIQITKHVAIQVCIY